jgi:hypothetical protein
MVEFVVRDREVVAKAVAETAFWRNFRSRYAMTFLLGMVLWPALIVLSYRTRGDTWFIGFFGFMFFVTLIWTPVTYFARRRAAVVVVKKYPERNVRVTPGDITIATTDGSTTLPWRMFKDIWEYPGFFIFARELGIYWWLPKSDMPHDAVMIVRQAAAALPSNNRLQRTVEE